MESLQSFAKQIGPAVYVVWTGSPNAAAADVNVRGVYADAADAAAACAVLTNKGIASAHMSGVMISTPGEIGADGNVWLYSGTGSASFTAFGNMDAADARRVQLGGKVRPFQVIGWAADKAWHGGDLRKRGLTPEVLGKLATEKSARDAPAETAKVAHELIKLAHKTPLGVAQFLR